MQVWKIGTDPIPREVYGAQREWDLDGERRYSYAYEAIGYRAGEFIVENEEGVLSFQQIDPREVEVEVVEPKEEEKVMVRITWANPAILDPVPFEWAEGYGETVVIPVLQNS
jgi:hypothetical protein